MTKKDLVKKVHEVHGGVSYVEAQQMLDSMIRIIKDRIAKQEKVTLTGFGVFQVNRRKERQIRDLKTGTMIQLQPLNYLTFRTSRLVQVNNSDEQKGPEEIVLQNRGSMQASGH